MPAPFPLEVEIFGLDDELVIDKDSNFAFNDCIGPEYNLHSIYFTKND